MLMFRQYKLEDPVCIVDLGVVARLFTDWMTAMPRVVPFYAVKANNDEGILAMLAALGAGFDCASDAEVCFPFLSQHLALQYFVLIAYPHHPYKGVFPRHKTDRSNTQYLVEVCFLMVTCYAGTLCSG